MYFVYHKKKGKYDNTKKDDMNKHKTMYMNYNKKVDYENTYKDDMKIDLLLEKFDSICNFLFYRKAAL
jgi:hypothetical protein